MTAIDSCSLASSAYRFMEGHVPGDASDQRADSSSFPKGERSEMVKGAVGRLDPGEVRTL